MPETITFLPLLLSTNHIMPRLRYCSTRKLWGLSFGFVASFFKVLVNLSHFLQEVSRKLGGVMFLLHFSDINHYYVHPRSQVLPGRFWWWAGFPGQSAVRTPSSSTGSVVYAEGDSITRKKLSCWPAKRSLTPCIQQFPATINNCIHPADGTKMGGLSILFKDVWGDKKNHLQNHPPQAIISYNLFSKLSFKI